MNPKSTSPQTFIFFGPSGSGKGTQSELVIEYLKKLAPDIKTINIQTGQKFRDFSTQSNFTAHMTKEVMETGALMPEFLPIWMWTGMLIEDFTGKEHLIFDGMARREHEAVVLDSALRFYKRENPIVVSINVGDAWATERLLARKRLDDTEIEIKKRLTWYRENVLASINFFKNNPYYQFVEINGEQTIEDVHKEILSKIDIRINE